MLELITEVGAGEAGGYKQLVANVATLITVLNFLVGSAQVSCDWWILRILTSDWSAQCREFYQQQSTGSASPASYLVGVMMTFSWYSYGILRNSGASLRVLSTLYFVNKDSGIPIPAQSCLPFPPYFPNYIVFFLFSGSFSSPRFLIPKILS